MPRPRKNKSPLGNLLRSITPPTPAHTGGQSHTGTSSGSHHHATQGEGRSHGAPHRHHKPFRRDQHHTQSSAVAGAPAHQQKKMTGTFQYGKASRRPVRKPHYKSTASENPNNDRKKTKHIPPLAAGTIRIIPLGGVEEIGKNMTAIEIGDDIIVIDAGMYFSNEETPGIDYVIPNTTYLEERKDKIRAMLVTHGHLDHIGGIPIVMDRIGNPPLYSRNLSVLMMKKRQSEFPHLPPLNVQVVEKNETIMCGNIKVRFFGVTHTIPDSMGIIIETPYGLIVTPGDYKLDQIDGHVTDTEEKEYAIFDKANVLLLLTDSTNIENEGFALPEIKVHQGLDVLIRRITGRIIIAAFASHISRLMYVINVAEALNKKVVLEGRSMRTNLEVAIEAGLLKPKKDTIIPIEDVDKYPANRILILMTGAQGEEFAALNRAANKSHKKFTLKKGDTIILSASIVPGNERAVEKMKDGLARQGVRIISYRTPGEEFVHATGHGNQEDVKWLHRKTHPKFFIPIHGNHYRLQLHKELAMELGMPENHIIVPDNGSIIEIQDSGSKMVLLKEKAPASPMMVDGLTVGDEQDVVIRDRQMLSEDGMFVVVVTLDMQTGKLKKSPDIISRGFVYLKESQDLLHHARAIIKKTVEENSGIGVPNFEAIKGALGENLSKYLFQKTAKRPLIIPVLVSI